MKALLKILLSLNTLRKEIGFNHFFSAIKFDHHLQINPKLNYKKVLVLAPHPDDDIFGCGGVMALMTKRGATVTVAYFCDGSFGSQKSEVRSRRLIGIRKEEAKKAAAILGVKEQVFFGYPDGKLAAGTSVNKAFGDLIKRVNPDIILTPSFLDNHPDHRAVNEILINCKAKNIDNLEIWAYEVWTPIFANRVVDISDVIESKKKAIMVHQSQLESRLYDKAILALNQYRAEINGVNGYAESFFTTTLEIYRKLYQKS